jgi:hypothetical protein
VSYGPGTCANHLLARNAKVRFTDCNLRRNLLILLIAVPKSQADSLIELMYLHKIQAARRQTREMYVQYVYLTDPGIVRFVIAIDKM